MVFRPLIDLQSSENALTCSYVILSELLFPLSCPVLSRKRYPAPETCLSTKMYFKREMLTPKSFRPPTKKNLKQNQVLNQPRPPAIDEWPVYAFTFSIDLGMYSLDRVLYSYGRQVLPVMYSSLSTPLQCSTYESPLVHNKIRTQRLPPTFSTYTPLPLAIEFSPSTKSTILLFHSPRPVPLYHIVLSCFVTA